MAPSPSSAHPLVGRQVDHYRVLAALGQGGMGHVYKVHNTILDRTEALKVIAPSLVRDAAFLRRFQREARSLARVHHPGIVTIYTLAEAEGTHYITMEYVEGCTLADLLEARGALPWTDVVPLMRQLLQALAYAHARGVVHRDLKPRNLMLTPTGQVKVMDFGLAKNVQQHDVTRTVGVTGTLFYMSPEQVKGEAQDGRSDLFSLGMTLYELLAGRLPFDKDSGQYTIQRAIVEDVFPTPTHFNRDVPDALGAIILRSIQKRPADRFQSAEAMLEALRAFERSDTTLPDGGPAGDTLLPPVSEPPDPDPPAVRSRSQAWLWGAGTGVVVAGAGLVVLLVALLWALSRPDAPDVPSDPEPFAGLSTPSEPLLEPDASPTPVEAPPLDEALVDESAIEPPSQQITPSRTEEAPRRTPEIRQPQRQPATPALAPEAEPPAAEDAATDLPEDTSEPPVTEDAAPTEPPAPTVTAGLMMQAAQRLAGPLRQAVLSNRWDGVPPAVRAYYEPRIERTGLFGRRSKFEIVEAQITYGADIRPDGTQGRLPVSLSLTCQQKGRDVQKACLPHPLATVWTWELAPDGSLRVVQVSE